MDRAHAVITNHSLWHDTAGDLIDCHEGGIIRVGDTFFWIGRTYKGNVDAIYGTQGAHFRLGFVCYSSDDLVNWKNLGPCLPYPKDDQGWLTTGTWHRPRVIFNAKTGLYVLWFFVLGTPPERPWVRDMVATASSPAGPYTIVGERTIPGATPAGDLALLLDHDGRGYLANNDWARNNWVVALSDDFQHAVGPITIGLAAGKNPDRSYEGVCLDRYKGKYILAGSGVVGIGPSESSYAVADHPLGPYREKGLMSEHKTWNSQIGSFLYIKESDRLMALCDQWLVGPHGECVAAEHCCQLWIPVDFDPATETARLNPLARWNPWQKA